MPNPSERKLRQQDLEYANQALQSILVMRANACAIPQAVWTSVNALRDALQTWIVSLEERIRIETPADPISQHIATEMDKRA